MFVSDKHNHFQIPQLKKRETYFCVWVYFFLNSFPVMKQFATIWLDLDVGLSCHDYQLSLITKSSPVLGSRLSDRL